ncbi:MAG: UDP-glucose 4-epimerase GalE [Phycisphaera sp.]|nr:UDP-glucose 4-epimerase GalE [Phycisphaera sp.]
MKVMVTGGAGYIGSHAVRHLLACGHDVVVLDNLHRGHREAIPKHVPFEELDVRQTEALTNALTHHKIECVMHFAALAYVGESVTEPLKYFHNNSAGSLSLLQAMDAAGVRKLVFSSTCATYGQPDRMPITESTPQSPINPYGHSKLMTERMLIDYAAANKGFAFAALRYFNVAGSASDGSIGEDHEPETHIIPVMLNAALGKVPKVTVFGDDYATPDGTCIRDYIHVEDLVDAHVEVMKALKPGEQRFYNLGIGKGLSVKQLIDAAKKVTGVDFKVEMGPRRAGDPPMLYADASKIKNELGWSARHTDIERTVETAWRWFKNHPNGYAGA